MNPEFSIIVPTYNSQSYLKETLDSIGNQKVEMECLVIDNLSTDNTPVIARGYSTQGFNLISEKDRGQANAINKGYEKSRGEIFNWLNSDDYYKPDVLQIVKKNFNEDTFGVAGRSRIFDANGTKYYSRGTDVYQGNLAKTLGWARIDQPETFFRKSVWDTVGLLNEDLHYVFDREWWIRYLFYFGLEGFKKIPDILVNFRHHAISKTVIHKNEFEIEDRMVYAAYAAKIRATDIEELLLKSENVEGCVHIEIPKMASKEIIVSMIHYFLLKIGNQYYAQDNIRLATQFLRKVNPKFLYKEDRFLLKRLKYRNYIPKKIINVFRQK